MADETPPAGGKPKLSRNAKIGIGAGAAALVFYLWQRQKANAAAAAAVTTSADQGAGAGTTDTGVPLGTGTGPGAYGTDYSAASSSTIGTVSTNQDWFNAALQAVENAGYDAQTANVALSAFLASQPLTAAQQQIVRIGLAAAGQPPQGPTGVVTAPTGGGAGAGGGTTPPVTAPIGLRLTSLANTSFTIGWDGQANAHGYYTYVNGAKSVLLYGTLRTLNTFNANTPIKPNTKYSVQVTAVDAAGHESAKSGTLVVTTKK